jgi:hypothetical protein
MLDAATKRLIWVLTAVLLTGCAALPWAKPEDVVRQRAQARWDALMAGEWSKAYTYMAPSYRGLVDEKRYANQFGGGAAWLSAEVVKVSCTEDRCTVQMKVAFQPTLGFRAGQPATTYFDETWIREEGQWWMFQKV